MTQITKTGSAYISINREELAVNRVVWQIPDPTLSGFTKTKLFRAESEDGPYEQIAVLDIQENEFYDPQGTSSHYYKIQFTGDTYTSEMSDAFKGILVYAYSTPEQVLRWAGLTKETSGLQTYQLWDMIYEVSRMIDEKLSTVYGRVESFEYYADSKYLDLNRMIRLPYQNIKWESIKVYVRTGFDRQQDWRELSAGYEYETLEDKGWIRIYYRPLLTGREYKDIKVTGYYGDINIPSKIQQLTAILTAIRIFVNMTGGSFDDVTSYSMGGVSYSLGEPYTNMQATIKMLETEKTRLMKEIGMDAGKKYNYRMA